MHIKQADTEDRIRRIKNIIFQSMKNMTLVKDFFFAIFPLRVSSPFKTSIYFSEGDCLLLVWGACSGGYGHAASYAYEWIHNNHN